MLCEVTSTVEYGESFGKIALVVIMCRQSTMMRARRSGIETRIKFFHTLHLNQEDLLLKVSQECSAS